MKKQRREESEKRREHERRSEKRKGQARKGRKVAKRCICSIMFWGSGGSKK